MSKLDVQGYFDVQQLLIQCVTFAVQIPWYVHFVHVTVQVTYNNAWFWTHFVRICCSKWKWNETDKQKLQHK